MKLNVNDYLDIAPQVKEALKNGEPVVALESTILSHGMPYPQNSGFAAEVEKIIRAEGAVPATMAIIDGRMKAGLTPEELELMCKADHVAKVSRRDMPIIMATGKTGATTVTTTMDISADLQELAHTPVCVVCAGAKMILDIGLTLEYLETMGVPVIGMNTDDFPSFYCRKSGFGVDYNAPTPADVARVAKFKWDLGFQGGMLVGNPVPEQYAMDFDYMTKQIDIALAACEEAGIRGKETTPFLLAKIVELTGGDSLATNMQLAYNNARITAQIAVEYAKL